MNRSSIVSKHPAVVAAGMGWRIPTGCLHAFFTRGEALDVLAWHPDSDFGPIHGHHPMVNRTMVEGVSAARIDEIRAAEV